MAAGGKVGPPRKSANEILLELLDADESGVDAYGIGPVFSGTHNWGVPLTTNDAAAPGIHGVEAVHVLDHGHGVRYVVTIADDGVNAPALVTIWCGALRGTLDGATRIPDSELAAIAASYLRRRREWLADPANTEARVPGVDYSERAPGMTAQHRRPSLDRIADEVKLARHAGVSVEAWFDRAPWKVSPATARRWHKAAREAGLLPESHGANGRPTKRPADPVLLQKIRAAEDAGITPASALADEYDISPATARGWIRRLPEHPS